MFLFFLGLGVRGRQYIHSQPLIFGLYLYLIFHTFDWKDYGQGNVILFLEKMQIYLRSRRNL